MDAQFNWFSNLGVKGGIDVPFYILVGFQNINRIENLAQNNGLSNRPHVISAQCLIGIERFPVTGKNTDYTNHKNSQAYGELLSRFRNLHKYNFLQPYISQHDFRRDENFNLHVFDIPYQKHFCSPQNVEKEIRFSTASGHGVAAGKTGYTLILTNKVISISSEDILILYNCTHFNSHFHSLLIPSFLIKLPYIFQASYLYDKLVLHR